MAILATVGVWWLLFSTVAAPVQTEETTDQQSVVESADKEKADLTDSVADGTVIPADTKTVELTEGQREAAEAVGLEADSISITPAMIDCAAGKLSETRVAEIAAGDAPTALETVRLLPCLKAE